MEMVLRFNLGPLHLLDNLIEEIFTSESSKTYVRKETKISRLITKDLNKSAAVDTFDKHNEQKSRFPLYFRLTSKSK